MRIFTNAFPTNMPDSEKVSQGGPANFAKLFSTYIEANTGHEWYGLMMDASLIGLTNIRRKYSFPQRYYYQLRLPRRSLRLITKATQPADPTVILKKPLAKIVRLMEKVSPDVVFLNGFGLLNWMLLKAAEQLSLPTVIQHAGIWTKELGIHRQFYTAAGRKMMEKMEQDSSRLCACEIFLNEFSRDYYRRHVARGRGETRIIPLPFDFTAFRRLEGSKKKMFDSRDKNIGFIARWDEIKNHPAALALAKEALAAGHRWKFRSVVDIPDDGRDERFKRTYQKYMSLTPSLDRSGIARFCRSIDLLIVPSVFDVSPTVVLEAIASGTPVAISKTVGFASAFRRYGASKWVIDFDNPRSAFKKISRLLDEPMPKELVKDIKRDHSHSRVFRSYLEVFRSLSR